MSRECQEEKVRLRAMLRAAERERDAAREEAVTQRTLFAEASRLGFAAGQEVAALRVRLAAAEALCEAVRVYHRKEAGGLSLSVCRALEAWEKTRG